jgi:large subunit ribosomal protein L4
MAKANLYNASGVKTGEIELPEEIFGQIVNEALLHEAVVIHQANQRQGTAMGKNRALVSGGGKKPFKQKGTGNARQGTSTSPLNVRGGKPFAPVPHKYTMKLNRKAKQVALNSALSLRASAGKVVVFEEIAPTAPKTQIFIKTLATAELSEKKALVLVGESDKNLSLASRNVPTVELTRALDVNVYDVLWADTVILTRASLEVLKARKEAA